MFSAHRTNWIASDSDLKSAVWDASRRVNCLIQWYIPQASIWYITLLAALNCPSDLMPYWRTRFRQMFSHLIMESRFLKYMLNSTVFIVEWSYKNQPAQTMLYQMMRVLVATEDIHMDIICGITFAIIWYICIYESLIVHVFIEVIGWEVCFESCW